MQRAETQHGIEKIIDDFGGGVISGSACVLRIMAELDLVYHKAREESYKEILLALNKPNKKQGRKKQ